MYTLCAFCKFTTHFCTLMYLKFQRQDRSQNCLASDTYCPSSEESSPPGAAILGVNSLHGLGSPRKTWLTQPLARPHFTHGEGTEQD